MEIPEHMRKHAKKLHKRCQSQTDTPEGTTTILNSYLITKINQIILNYICLEVIRESLKGTLPKNQNFECYIHCLFDIIGVVS